MTRPADAVRAAVRRALAELAAAHGPGLALVACSGGPDSLALAAATAQAVRRSGWRAGAVVVDHGLQPGSADVAERTAQQCRGLGLDPVAVAAVTVGTGRGPEASARDARYVAFADTARSMGARGLLLGHTLDDQAETVLLGLARGSGARSLQGMPAVAPLPGAPATTLLRPLLGLRREQVEAACRTWELRPWNDPHNNDSRFARVRVRHEVLPALADALGPGVPQALARTAVLLRDDEAVLCTLAEESLARLPRPVECAALAGHPAALRRRMLRRLALDSGCPPADLTAGHLFALDEAVTSGRGGAEVALPGGVIAAVRCGRLNLAGEPTGGQE